MRRGLLLLVAWLLWRTIQWGREQPQFAIMWAARATVAVIMINALGGSAFGWLYWRRSLEAAMIAHAMARVVFMLGLATGVIA